MSRHFLIIDVEATCWERKDRQPGKPEIIEIGAVLLHAQRLTSLAEFQTFVKPVRSPLLSDFCTALTSIEQNDVDAAPLFPEAMALLSTEMLERRQIVFCSWGDYDRRQFLQDCKYHRIKYPFGKRHMNVKQLFAEKRRCRPCGMAQALAMMRMPLTGTHHRAIDDASNIARLAAKLL